MKKITLTIIFVFILTQTYANENGRGMGRGEIDFKLLFNQIFMLNIQKAYPASKFQEIIEDFTYYTPLNFNEIVSQISKAKSSMEAFELRRQIFEGDENRNLLEDDFFQESIPDQYFYHPKINKFLKNLEDLPFVTGTEYWSSPRGKNLMEGITYNIPQGVLFVLVPGFAGHTMDTYIFEEIPFTMNLHNGRVKKRPKIGEKDYVSTKEYYEKNIGENFDIIHPMGMEQGNSVGSNERAADSLYAWLNNLPKEYMQRKMIIIGYSKGAPTILDLYRKYPDIRHRIMAMASYGGVNQGTVVTRGFLEKFESTSTESGKTLIEELMGKHQDSPKEVDNLVNLAFQNINSLFYMLLKFPAMNEFFNSLGFTPKELEYIKMKIGNHLEGEDLSQVVKGAVDLSPYERIKWNLRYLNSDFFDQKRSLPFYALSALTNGEDFLGRLNEDGTRGHSLMDPQSTKFSLDAIFLSLSSSAGFEASPGGLFDCQVELPSSKFFTADTRPISKSLSKKELLRLYKDPDLQEIYEKNQIDNFNKLANTPRNKLIKEEFWPKSQFIDLGEHRGHHWGPLRQAFPYLEKISDRKPEWEFPRMSYMLAFLETLAISNIVEQIKKEEM